MTLVDPFVPTRPQTPLATPRPPQPAAHANPRPQPQPPATVVVKKTFAAPPQKTSRFKSATQLTAIIVWALALGLGTYIQAVGEVAILSYAIVALILKFSGRTTFALALTAFLGVAVLQVVQPDSEMLSNFIVYAFLLLIFGSVTTGLEIRGTKQWRLRGRDRHTKLQR